MLSLIYKISECRIFLGNKLRKFCFLIVILLLLPPWTTLVRSDASASEHIAESNLIDYIEEQLFLILSPKEPKVPHSELKELNKWLNDYRAEVNEIARKVIVQKIIAQFEYIKALERETISQRKLNDLASRVNGLRETIDSQVEALNATNQEVLEEIEALENQ